MQDDDKRKRRQEKRDVKRDGNRRRRRALKRQLDQNPEEAPFASYEFKFDASARLNEPAPERSKKKPRRERVRDEEE